MKTTLSLFIFISSLFLVSYKTENGSFNTTLKPVLELRFSQTGGTNGCAIAYNSEKRLYYAAIAGNSSFPLEVFNESGVLVYKTTTVVDLRGLWYNKKKNRLEGNLASEAGIFALALNSYGFPTGELERLTDYIEMPDIQSVGAFTGKKVLFLTQNGIAEHKGKGSFKLKKNIDFTGSFSSSSNYNSTTIVYTGKKNEELAVLDYVNKKINLFNAKGEFSKQLVLPSAYATSQRFCFSYANETFFLYDTGNRVWVGFR